MLKTDFLQHAGIMVNYLCTAACRHCLYACSPSREKGYLTEAREICSLLREGGCSSVHIGGGEPFLDFEGLLRLVRELSKSGVGLDYIETNAFWASGSDAPHTLKALRAETKAALCISTAPFHAEYVPAGEPLRLARLCDEAGVSYFLWKEEFLPALSRLDGGKAHSRSALEKTLSPAYIGEAAMSYGIRMGGRAVNIEEEYGSLSPAAQLADAKPCGRLLSTAHFHVDLHGYFIPPGCTGIRIPLAEAVRGIPEGKYRAFEALYEGGPARLLALAKGLGFAENPRGYASRCGLCFHLRHFLSAQNFPELPREHYEESLKYY